MSDFEKWMLVLQIGSGLLQGYGNYSQGQQQLGMDKNSLEERKREFDASQASQGQQFGASLSEQQRQFNTPTGLGLSKSIALSPLSDRAAYMLGSRMGMSPGQFSPASLTQGGSQGGIDQSQLQAANNNYTPGAGGLDEHVALMKKLLASYNLGGGMPSMSNPSGAPPQSGSGTYAGNYSDVTPRLGPSALDPKQTVPIIGGPDGTHLPAGRPPITATDFLNYGTQRRG